MHLKICLCPIWDSQPWATSFNFKSFNLFTTNCSPASVHNLIFFVINSFFISHFHTLYRKCGSGRASPFCPYVHMKQVFFMTKTYFYKNLLNAPHTLATTKEVQKGDTPVTLASIKAVSWNPQLKTAKKAEEKYNTTHTHTHTRTHTSISHKNNF